MYILFVCTGNLCRSPMARVLFEDIVSKDPMLSSTSIEVDSAGTDVAFDSATPQAIAVMRECGLDLTCHQPKQVDTGLIERADLILVMESWQKLRIAYYSPAAESRAFTLTEYVGEDGNVSDPYGGDIDTYRDCAARLQRLLTRLAETLKEHG